MDSITQIALGSAVGYAVLGNKVGKKAALYGAILGTLPDLDVFVSFGGPVEDFTYHRSFSHSFLVQLLISPLIAWLLIKLHPATKIHKVGWFWLVFLTLSTHALLDSFTVYGTQLLWPLTEYPFGISNLFIIDPLYTLPLLVGLFAFLWPKVSHQRLHRINTMALTLSSIYIVWSLIAKWHIDNKIDVALKDNGLEKGVYESTPAPFTTLLWRAVVVNDDKYYEIFTSVFDSPSQVSIDAYPTSPELLDNITEEWSVQRLKWFTKGLYSVNLVDDSVVLSDLRMGIEGSYVFSFEVGKVNGTKIVTSDNEQFENQPDLGQAGKLWDRIWDANVSLSPTARAE